MRNKLPLIRTLLAFNAYSEGWALYASSWPTSSACMTTSRPAASAICSAIAFRACRLVVDTGLHAKRWTREQGVRFFVDENGSKPEEVASEVDRYCSWPGQACGYKVGHTTINRQRDRRRRRSGRGSTSGPSTTRWCLAATCRWTCSPRTSTNISGSEGAA